MKRTSIFIALVCLVFLAWTMSCKSPSSTGNPASSQAADNTQAGSNTSNDSSDSGSDNEAGASMGSLRLMIKDAPVEDAKNIFVTISDIRVHEACDDGEDCFTTISDVPMTIDLLSLQTTPLALPTTALPAGTYNQIRMAVTSGEIVFGPAGPPSLADVHYPLDVPSDEIKSHLHFVLEKGQTVLVTLDFDAKNSIHVIKKGKKDSYQLRPVVNVVEVVENSGS
jgi:Domain of unknown function (DUF4382)